jgi:hypothetical protein
VVDDALHYGIVCKEWDDLHRAAAAETSQGIHLVHFSDLLGPALGREAPELFFNNWERRSRKVCLFDLPPVGIGVEAELC